MRLSSFLVWGGLFVGGVNAAPIVDLYVHPIGGAGGGILGSGFEFADDFIIPSGQTWSITSVISAGFGDIGTNFQVAFYSNAIGSSTACSRSAINLSTAPMEFSLPTPCTLTAGTYWYGIRTFTSSPSIQHSTTPTLDNSAARMRDTFSSFCGTTILVPIGDCFSSFAGHDLAFTVRGCQGTSCDFPVAATASCTVDDALEVNITGGDGPFNITGDGPGLPLNGVAATASTLPGPNLWQNVNVVETAGDMQTLSLGTVNCGTPAVTLVESAGSTDVDEGDVSTTDTYTLVLAASPDPGEEVTISPSSDTINGVTVSPGNAVFDPTDWSMPVTFTVTAVDDMLFESLAHTSTITHGLSSTEARYAGVMAPSVVVNVLDNEPEFIFADGFEALPPAPPTFTSSPVTNGVNGEFYSYSITTSDPNTGDILSITAVSVLPFWLDLTDAGDGTATLSGVATDVGGSVTLRVTDSTGLSSDQSFEISVNEPDGFPPPPAFCTQDLSNRQIQFDIFRDFQPNPPDGAQKVNYEGVWGLWPGSAQTQVSIPKGKFVSLPFVAADIGQFWQLGWVGGPTNGVATTVTISPCPGDFDVMTLALQSCAQSGGTSSAIIASTVVAGGSCDLLQGNIYYLNIQHAVFSGGKRIEGCDRPSICDFLGSVSLL